MTDASPRASVAVIGGGIAGAAAAIALARQGLRPLWLAPAAKAEPAPVGDSLSPAAGPMLQSLGIAGLLACPPHRPSNTMFMSWGGPLTERNSAVHLEGPGWVVDRDRFERDLAAAADAGADRAEAALLHARPTGKGWQLMLENGEQHHAAVVIDATGRAARLAAAQSTRQRIDRQVAVTALLRQDSDAVAPTPATLIEAVAGGWWYAALLPSGILSLAFFSDPDLLPPNLSRRPERFPPMWQDTRYVARWIAEAGFTLATAPRLSSAGTTWLDPPAGIAASGDPWLAAGDAVASFDPLSSHGITTALWSGMQAAKAAAAWLEGDAAPLARYVESVRRGLDEFLAQRSAIYARERRFAAAPYWQRRQASPPG